MSNQQKKPETDEKEIIDTKPIPEKLIKIKMIANFFPNDMMYRNGSTYEVNESTYEIVKGYCERC